MEDPEVPLEEVHEHVHHLASHGPSTEPWTMRVALSTALFAAIAAIASLIAGQEANEAMAAQIQSSDQWSFYQAKSIKANLLDTKDELLVAMGRTPNAKDAEKRATYGIEKDAVKELATEKANESVRLLQRHEWMARAVTMFQVAIALSAIAMLTKQRLFWRIGLGLGAIGIAFFAASFAQAAFLAK